MCYRSVPSTLNMQEFTFTLTETEANQILAALQELPAKIANPLTQKLVQQANAQVKSTEAPEA